MKRKNFLLIIASIVIAQSAYSATGFLKLIINKSPYKVNVQGTGGNRKIRSKNGQYIENSDAVYPTDSSLLDYIDYSIPKGWGSGRLFIFVYDDTNKIINAGHILDVEDSVIRLYPLTAAELDPTQVSPNYYNKIHSSMTISSKDHDIAFRVIVKEDGTIKLAE